MRKIIDVTLDEVRPPEGAEAAADRMSAAYNRLYNKLILLNIFSNIFHKLIL